MATLSASAASAGCGNVLSPNTRATMRSTWIFSALPLPVIAIFASVGVCRATGMPRCAAASIASPAACAVPSTVLRFSCANTRSIETISGAKRSIFSTRPL